MPTPSFPLLSRRRFFQRGSQIGLGVLLSSLVDIPSVMKQALASGPLGRTGRKVLFIFLRGANDSLNSVIPVRDPAYCTSRPVGGTNIGIPMDPGGDAYYDVASPCDFFPSGEGPTYGYANALRLGNQFAALHPALKFLAPVYNRGQLVFIHRVAYPRQSRSHFDSQRYWETGAPNNKLVADGLFYRTILESGLAATEPLTGVSIQSSLPLILRGSRAAMTNLSDVSRYDLLGVPTGNTPAGTNGNLKAQAFLEQALGCEFTPKMNRELLDAQYQNLLHTLPLFEDIKAQMGVDYTDNEATDGDRPYVLFPRNNETNGGYRRNPGATPAVYDTNKYVTPANTYSFLTNLKAAALVLNHTQAVIAGTQLDGFDTHRSQGGPTGSQANLLRQVAWGIYALYKYFTTQPGQVTWDNLLVVTLSEFGRTTVMNADLGTDHAEAGVMFIAGGGVKGHGTGGFNGTGVYGCSPADALPWIEGPSGSMFGASRRYLKRAYDYRQVLGRIIRDHLGASQSQLDSIIPGYQNPNEKLLSGGTSGIDGGEIMAEPPFI